jgi:hypothetical protein
MRDFLLGFSAVLAIVLLVLTGVGLIVRFETLLTSVEVCK